MVMSEAVAEGLTETDACAASPGASRLTTVDAALERGLALAQAISGTELLPLADATGRILAEPAVAELALPPFDNAAMDGYAVRLGELRGEGPWRLAVAGRIAAGDPPRAMPPSGALRILTGALVPAEASAVVMQERVRLEDGAIVLAERPREGLNIRRAGEDLPAGGTILSAGVVIGAREAAALAAIGLAEVPVRRRLRVAIFSTGSELVQPGERLGSGQIYNSNRYMLRAALHRPWIELRDLGAVADDPATLVDTLRDAARDADLVVSTGGVSGGDADHMPDVLRAGGGDIHAMRIAMKPGKPLAVGRMGEAVYIGLPGNPVSAFVTWHVVGAPIAARRAGLKATNRARTTAAAGFDLTRQPGRCEFRPARIVTDEDGRPVAELLSASYSARIAMLAAADGLVVLPADAARITRGDLLTFHPLGTHWPL